MQKRRTWPWFLVVGLVGCGAELAPETSAQPTVLARYDGMIIYAEGGSSYSVPSLVRVTESDGGLVLDFEKPVPSGPFKAWAMTEVPPDRFALSQLSAATTGGNCLLTTWRGLGSGEFTLARAQFDISGTVHQDTCDEGPLDSQFTLSFAGTAVR